MFSKSQTLSNSSPSVHLTPSPVSLVTVLRLLQIESWWFPCATGPDRAQPLNVKGKTRRRFGGIRTPHLVNDGIGPGAVSSRWPVLTKERIQSDRSVPGSPRTRQTVWEKVGVSGPMSQCLFLWGDYETKRTLGRQVLFPTDRALKRHKFYVTPDHPCEVPTFKPLNRGFSSKSWSRHWDPCIILDH